MPLFLSILLWFFFILINAFFLNTLISFSLFLALLPFFPLLLTLLLFRTTRKRNLALHFVIILKDIAYKLTIGYIKISLLDSYSLNESLTTIFIAFLIFLNLSVCFLDVRKPLDHPPSSQGST